MHSKPSKSHPAMNHCDIAEKSNPIQFLRISQQLKWYGKLRRCAINSSLASSVTQNSNFQRRNRNITKIKASTHPNDAHTAGKISQSYQTQSIKIRTRIKRNIPKPNTTNKNKERTEGYLFAAVNGQGNIIYHFKRIIFWVRNNRWPDLGLQKNVAIV